MFQSPAWSRLSLKGGWKKAVRQSIVRGAEPTDPETIPLNLYEDITILKDSLACASWV
jgi:hypothetical protein